MKYILALSASILFSTIQAQVAGGIQPQTGKIGPSGTINVSDTMQADYEPTVVNIKEQPNPSPTADLKAKKAALHKQRLESTGNSVKKNAARGTNPSIPIVVTGFNANTSQGTPNDNHIAISNNGVIVSVVNSNMRVYDTLGNLKSNKSLQSFAQPLGTFTGNSDPRVMYDPTADRFILLFFSGNTSKTNKIVVGFSQTNDPSGQWNLYALPGNYLNDTTWSDYPIVSLSNSDLFITFNQLNDNEGWQTGFRYSIIWQINKGKGFAGDSLSFNYWSRPTHDGEPIWSICPVMEGSEFSSNESYFLSVIPYDLNNDTVFLHTISNTQASGTAQFTTRVLKNTTPYGLAPNGIQPDNQQLATNDARVLHAIIHNKRIYYAQNCKSNSFTAGIYLGRIDNPADATPTLSAKIIGYDTLDLGYPSFAHIGKGSADYRTFLTCSFVSQNQYPGTAAFFIDNDGDISEMAVVHTGDNNLNILGDTVERWGDYTGIQRRFNEDFTAWLSGSYARANGSYGTWVAKLTTEDSLLISSVNDRYVPTQAKLFPNPATDYYHVEFETEKNNLTTIELFSINGTKVATLLEDRFKPGTNRFSFNTAPLSSGTYILQITENGKRTVSKKLSVVK